MKASPALLAFLASGLVLAALVGILILDSPKAPDSSGDLLVYCAPGIRAPVEQTAREYQAAFGTAIRLHYGNSQSLLSSALVSRRGDLLLPADESYLKTARSKTLVREIFPFARMKPILAVRKGNPKGISSIESLANVRVALASPEAAVGKLVEEALSAAGKWEDLRKRAAVLQPTVGDVANDVKLGAVDAGFIWDAMLLLYPELEAVEIMELRGVEANIAGGVLESARNPRAALRFARYLAACDRGLEHFRRSGYSTVDGDAWADVPLLRVHAGAMLRPALEPVLKKFAEREGVEISRNYNGCGILVAAMKAGEKPDCYFSCDSSFMAEVKDMYQDREDISLNQLVILVPKGNPKRIRGLADLALPGLKVGIGNEKQCALGVLTQKTFVEGGLQARISPNVKVQTPTGDLLVNELRTGALDAVVAYITNASSAREALEAIPIDIPCALATQPIGVGKESKHKYLAGRLVDAIRASKEIFLSEGFGWKAKSP